MPKNLGNIKEEIVKVTRIMLEDKGYNKLNIREIASGCNIGIGTFYNYFKSKHEILSEIIRNDWETMLINIDKGIECKGEAVSKLLFIFNQIDQFMKHTHGVWFGEFSNDLGEFDINMVREMKKGLRSELSSRVKASIQGEVEIDKVDFYSDLITRIFISYANENFDNINDLTELFKRILLKQVLNSDGGSFTPS